MDLQVLGEQLLERVDAWPAPAERLAMLRQLATLAWEQGAMPQMERICDRICKLEPPDPVALQALMQASMSKPAAERVDCATRDVIPYLLCVPSGLPRLAAFDAMLELIRAVPELKPGMKAQQRRTALRSYAIDAKLRMLTVHYSSNERELEHSANGASSPAVVPSATMNQFIELARQLQAVPGLQGLPIIITSGFITDGLRAEAAAVGVRATLVTFSQTSMPLMFGALGATLGMTPVFLSMSLLLAAGAWYVRRTRVSDTPPA